MKKRQFIILILLLIIGFASVSTTLILSGNIGVGVELDDFDVIFIEALLGGKEDSKATISEDKKTITFTTDKFINKGDTARLDYKVKNTSTQYDADVTINCTNEASEYVTVTSEFDSNAIPLVNPVNIKAQEVKRGYINAELTKTYAGEDDSLEISCKITFTATSREDYAYSLNFDSNGGSKIEDKVIILDKAYGELQEPTKEGYTFLGWYDELDEKVDSSTILDSKGDRTLYAKWEEKVYPVSIITNANGTSEINSLNVAYGNTSNIKITPSNNYYISNVECDNGYTVEEYNSKVPEYGEQTIKIKNNEVDKSGTCTFSFEKGIYEYGYTGSGQRFSVPLNGDYRIELWGAQGGDSYYGGAGGMGGYTSGEISLSPNNTLYVIVGAKGQNGHNNYNFNPVITFNGGGAGANTTSTLPVNNSPYVSGSGGGATDIRLSSGSISNFNSTKTRIMVAGGGGGSAYSNSIAGVGGGNIGGSSTSSTGSYGGTLGSSGATQTSGGVCGVGTTTGNMSYMLSNNGFFSQGGSAVSWTHPGGGGGGGYYGGAGGATGGGSIGGSAGSGGSSFISGYSGCNAIAESSTSSNIIHTGQPNHYSGYVFTNTKMIAGNAAMPNYSGIGTMTGNSGNGYAKITLISID